MSPDRKRGASFAGDDKAPRSPRKDTDSPPKSPRKSSLPPLNRVCTLNNSWYRECESGESVSSIKGGVFGKPEQVMPKRIEKLDNYSKKFFQGGCGGSERHTYMKECTDELQKYTVSNRYTAGVLSPRKEAAGQMKARGKGMAGIVVPAVVGPAGIPRLSPRERAAVSGEFRRVDALESPRQRFGIQLGKPTAPPALVTVALPSPRTSPRT